MNKTIYHLPNEVRLTKFNLRDFLEEFYLSDTEEERQNIFNTFLSFYKNSSNELKEQVVKYIRNSIIYKENQHLALYLESIF